MKDNLTIHLYTACYNEMDVLPFVIDYWKRLADHVYVYDNGSTDGSVEFLKRHDWIEVSHYETEGMNDTVLIDIKNNAWKASRGQADYVCVCDIDECIYSKNARQQLMYMKENGYTTASTKWYDFISVERPRYEDGKLLHEVSSLATYNEQGKPCAIFDPNKIQETNYWPGAHVCHPIGEVKQYDGDLYTLHINHRLSLQYYIHKYKQMHARLSKENLAKRYGYHYAFSQEKLTKMFYDDLARAVDFNELVR